MFSKANLQRQLHTFSAPPLSHCACSRRPYNRQVTFESGSTTELPLPLILFPCRDQGAYFIGLQKYQTSLICTQGRSTKCHAHTSSPFILWVYARRGMHKRTLKSLFLLLLHAHIHPTDWLTNKLSLWKKLCSDMNFDFDNKLSGKFIRDPTVPLLYVC